MNSIFRSRKGQGTTEYIVVLAIAVGLIVTIFWGRIRGVLDQKVTTMSNQIRTAGNP